MGPVLVRMNGNRYHYMGIIYRDISITRRTLPVGVDCVLYTNSAFLYRAKAPVCGDLYPALPVMGD